MHDVETAILRICLLLSAYITHLPMHYAAIFQGYDGNCHMKNCDIFLIFTENIHCGYSLVRRFKQVPKIYVLEQK